MSKLLWPQYFLAEHEAARPYLATLLKHAGDYTQMTQCDWLSFGGPTGLSPSVKLE